MGEALASRGVVTVVADYRLSPDVRYPVFLQDCALAVRWARDNATRWGASAGRVFAVGHSAGAYNAAMGSNYNRIPRPAAVLVRDGVADLVQRREQPEDLLRYDVLPARLTPVI